MAKNSAKTNESIAYAYTIVLLGQSTNTEHKTTHCTGVGGLVYPMKTVHTVQSFLDTFCQNGLQFRIICACKVVKGANCNRHSVITASWLNSPPPPPPAPW